MEHAEILLPWAYGITVLEGECAGDLVQVGEVVGCPRGEELREGDDAESWVTACAGEVGWSEVQTTEFGEAFGAEAGELSEEVSDGG
jgi:hypothetical protein